MANQNIAKLPERVKAKLDDWIGGDYETLFWWEQDKTWFVAVQYLTIIQFIRLFPMGDNLVLSADGSVNVNDLADKINKVEA